ncbi:MAG: SdrD B-like domain-containing protein, partial [Verrucomicrobiota bacterium]
MSPIKSFRSFFQHWAALSLLLFVATELVVVGQSTVVATPTVITVDAGFEADDGAPDTFRLVRRASALEISVNGSLLMLVDSEDAGGINVIGSSDNDTLIVDTSGGNPIPDGGVTFDGGGQTGPPGDALRVIGDGKNHGAYEVSATSAGTGTLRLDGRAIRFTGLEPVEVSGLGLFTFTTPNSDDVLTISAGTGSGGQPANVIAGTSGGTAFESLTFFDVALFIIDTGSNDAVSAGNDSITIDSSGLIARNLQSLNIFTGRGDDTLSIQAGNFSLPSPGGSFVFEGGSGSDRIDAQADVKFTLSNNQLLSSGGSAINLMNIENADLTGGTNANSFVVSNWSGYAVLDGREGGDAYVVNLGGGGLVVINDTSLTSVDQGTINGTTNNDIFTVTSARTVSGNDTVYYANLETITVNGVGGDDTITVAPVTNALLTIDGGPQINGDNLIFDLAGVTAPQVTGASPATFGNRLPVSFLNFEQLGPTATISGTIFHDVDGDDAKNPGEPGLAGWTVFLDRNFNDTVDSEDIMTTTDASGSYFFGNLLPNTYRVHELPPDGWLQTTASPLDIVLTGTNLTGVDFGNFQTIAITGQVYQDDSRDGQKEPGEPGLQGRTVFLDQNNNGVLDSDEPFRVTISGGNYSFLKLGPGTYRVRQVVQSGSIQTSAHPADIVAASGANHSGVDFGNAPPDTTPPTSPPAPGLSPSSDTGLSNSDNLTSVTNLVFQGTAESNSLIELFANT